MQQYHVPNVVSQQVPCTVISLIEYATCAYCCTSSVNPSIII